MTETRFIFCMVCENDMPVRLTNGAEVYPHRKDLRSLPFWRCDSCGNWVGCHHKSDEGTKPLGVIPSPEMKRARGHIHKLLDPLWKRNRIDRRELYGMMADRLGIEEYHTAELRTIDAARDAYRAAREIAQEINYG